MSGQRSAANPAAGQNTGSQDHGAGLTPQEKELLDRIDKLEKQVAELRARIDQNQAPPQPSIPVTAQNLAVPVVQRSSQSTSIQQAATFATAVSTAAPPATPANVGQTKAATQAAAHPPPASPVPDFLSGTTLNFDLDGYYGYNFNNPLGGVNLLRAYDVLSNSFSLNQAGVIVERAADLSQNRPFGFRLDLMYGQATETLQGSPVNEPRPQVYRNIAQAYGDYIVPVGNGLTIQFGKWFCSLGEEGNYTKDQLNYSRAFFYNFLPFYHMGFLASYPINKELTVQYWLTNGANQTESFNQGRSNAFAFIVTPDKSTSWHLNYFEGNQQRAFVPDLNPGIPSLPTQPGLSTTPIEPSPNGREHILDSYATWNVTNKLLFSGEGDYVISRVFSNSPPAEVSGGAGYVKYQFTPAFDLAGRFEYLDDQGGLFSGKTQDLKEGTLTATYQFGEGFQLRGEFRRDFSNQPFFLTNLPNVFKRDQNTATVGMIWWFGGKQGAW